MRVLIVPLEGKHVKDQDGQIVPPDGRHYFYGPYWIRARKRSLVSIIQPVVVPSERPVAKKKGKNT